MSRAIGFVIVLFALSTFFSQAFTAFEEAATSTFEAVEAAAALSTQQLKKASD
jgi:hypothetical protein